MSMCPATSALFHLVVNKFAAEIVAVDSALATLLVYAAKSPTFDNYGHLVFMLNARQHRFSDGFSLGEVLLWWNLSNYAHFVERFANDAPQLQSRLMDAFLSSYQLAAHWSDTRSAFDTVFSTFLQSQRLRKYILEYPFINQPDVMAQRDLCNRRFHIAGRVGHLDFVKHLVDYCVGRIDFTYPDSKGDIRSILTPALEGACAFRHLEVVQYILQHCSAHVSEHGWEDALWAAALTDSVSAVRALVDFGKQRKWHLQRKSRSKVHNGDLVSKVLRSNRKHRKECADIIRELERTSQLVSA